MTKFQRIQQISSVIPFASSGFVFVATYIELARKRARMKYWLLFILIWALAFLAVCVVDRYLMSGQFPVLNILASGGLMALANLFSVDLQVKCKSSDRAIAKYWRVIGITVVAVVLAVIVVTTMIVFLFKGMEHIPDTNGPEDTGVTAYTMEQLCTAPDQYRAYMSGSSYTGDKGVFHAKKFSGLETILTVTPKAGTLVLDADAQLVSGNMEVVILVDGTYHSHIPLNAPQEILLEDVAGKPVSVRFAAESAEMSLSVECRTN